MRVSGCTQPPEADLIHYVPNDTWRALVTSLDELLDCPLLAGKVEEVLHLVGNIFPEGCRAEIEANERAEAALSPDESLPPSGRPADGETQAQSRELQAEKNGRQ